MRAAVAGWLWSWLGFRRRVALEVGRALLLMGGLKELDVISAAIVAAYDEDMFSWNLMSSSTAEGGSRRQQHSGSRNTQEEKGILERDVSSFNICNAGNKRA